MKKYLLAYTTLALISGVVVAFDQWTKNLVRTRLAFEQVWAPWDWLIPYARVIHWKNSGAAFGMLQGYNLLFTLLAIGVSIAIIYYYPRISPADWWLRLALGLQLGGALGNLIDRLILGQVTDFISVGTFAVFNVADASISVGTAILLLGVWITDSQKKKEGKSGSMTSGQDPAPAGPESKSGE